MNFQRHFYAHSDAHVVMLKGNRAMCVRTSAIVAAILMLAALCPAPALAQTISSGSGYSITFNGNQQAFFSNIWDGSSQQAPNNIALSGQGSTAFGSSQFGGPHLITQVNDGVYGNNRSWLSNLTGTQASIGIAFSTAQSLSSIAWGRDNCRNSTATPTGGGDTLPSPLINIGVVVIFGLLVGCFLVGKWASGHVTCHASRVTCHAF